VGAAVARRPQPTPALFPPPPPHRLPSSACHRASSTSSSGDHAPAFTGRPLTCVAMGIGCQAREGWRDARTPLVSSHPVSWGAVGGGEGGRASAWGGAQAGARARAFSAGTRVCRGPPRDGAARAMEWAAAAHPRGRQARHPTGFRPGSAPPMRRAAPRGAAGLPGAAAGCGRPFGRWRVGRPGSHLTREGGVWGGARLEKTALCGDWRAHTSTRPHRLPPPERPPLDGGPVCRARVGRGDALLPRRPNPARRPHADLQGARRARPGPGCRREPGRGRPQR